MRQWLEAITDRSQSDITEKTPKAYLNAVDVNRIANNIAYLSDTLRRMGYITNANPSSNWSRSSNMTDADLRNLCNFIHGITLAFYTPAGFTSLTNLPTKQLDYTDVNSIERNLLRIYQMIEQGMTHNSMRSLTHLQLRARTHAQIRTGV